MLRPACAALAALLLTAACETTGGGDVAVDPSPQAPLGEAITEPTDGFENEIEAE